MNVCYKLRRSVYFAILMLLKSFLCDSSSADLGRCHIGRVEKSDVLVNALRGTDVDMLQYVDALYQAANLRWTESLATIITSE